MLRRNSSTLCCSNSSLQAQTALGKMSNCWQSMPNPGNTTTKFRKKYTTCGKASDQEESTNICKSCFFIATTGNIRKAHSRKNKHDFCCHLWFLHSKHPDYTLGVAPSVANEGFLGSPTKNMIPLVVTATVKGPQPNYTSILAGLPNC